MTEDIEPPNSEVLSPPPKDERAAPEGPPERWVSILGFVIVTKADLLAAAAFLLSLVSVTYQFSAWMKGPSPNVYAPDLVYVFFDRYANNRTVVRFASQISAVNTAEVGHDTVIRDINLQVTAKDLSISETWLSFVTIQRDGTKLVVAPKEAAHPFPVVAGSAASNTVSFAPLEQSCPQVANPSGVAPSNQDCNPDRYFVSDIDFLNKVANVDALRLRFEARLVGTSKPLVAACTIAVGDAFRQYIAENDWFAARCQETDNRQAIGG